MFNDIYANDNDELDLEEIVEEEEPEEIVEEEVVEDEEPEELEEDNVVMGVVSCGKLNVRATPSADGDKVAEIQKGSEVMIDEAESTNDFYKVCTESSVEGFCMKKFITIQ